MGYPPHGGSPCRRGARGHRPGQDDPRGAHLGQHGHRAGHGGGGPGLQAHPHHARVHVHGAARAAQGVRLGPRADPRLERYGRRREKGRGHPNGPGRGRVHAAAVQQPGQPKGAPRDHGPGDLGPDRRQDRHPHRRRGHWRHHHGQHAVPQAQEALPQGNTRERERGRVSDHEKKRREAKKSACFSRKLAALTHQHP